MLFPDPVPIAKAKVILASALLPRLPAPSARDALHAAVVQPHHMEDVVTTDKGFQSMAEFCVFGPDTLPSLL